MLAETRQETPEDVKAATSGSFAELFGSGFGS